MSDARETGKSARPATRPAVPKSAVVAWQSGSGKDKLWHIVHIDSAGLTCALDLTERNQLQQLVDQASANPSKAAEVFGAHKGAKKLSRDKLSRVTYAKPLKQLIVVDNAGKKHHVAYGDQGEQEAIFEAVKEHLGGTPSEEEADAWSVVKNSVIALVVTIFAGGVFTKLAMDASPDHVATGRRAATEQALNNLLYKIGPIWTGVIFAAVAIGIATPMVLRLMKRPKRKVLAFQGAE
jgi:hypothetical protein